MNTLLKWWEWEDCVTTWKDGVGPETQLIMIKLMENNLKKWGDWKRFDSCLGREE